MLSNAWIGGRCGDLEKFAEISRQRVVILSIATTLAASCAAPTGQPTWPCFGTAAVRNVAICSCLVELSTAMGAFDPVIAAFVSRELWSGKVSSVHTLLEQLFVTPSLLQHGLKRFTLALPFWHCCCVSAALCSSAAATTADTATAAGRLFLLGGQPLFFCIECFPFLLVRLLTGQLVLGQPSGSELPSADRARLQHNILRCILRRRWRLLFDCMKWNFIGAWPAPSRRSPA